MSSGQDPPGTEMPLPTPHAQGGLRYHLTKGHIALLGPSISWDIEGFLSSSMQSTPQHLWSVEPS